MPQYLYKNPNTGEIKEVIQRMTEPHVYEENGVKFERIFSIPLSNIDSLSQINAFSEKDFLNKTNGRKLSIGDQWDISKELSQKREKILGHDPVKEKAVTDYQRRTGKPHPQKDLPKRIEVDFVNKQYKLIK